MIYHLNNIQKIYTHNLATYNIYIHIYYFLFKRNTMLKTFKFFYITLIDEFIIFYIHNTQQVHKKLLIFFIKKDKMLWIIYDQLCQNFIEVNLQKI